MHGMGIGLMEMALLVPFVLIVLVVGGVIYFLVNRDRDQ